MGLLACTLVLVTLSTITLTVIGYGCGYPHQHFMQRMADEQIIPDIIDTVPQMVLGVRYPTVWVNLGNNITPTQVKDQPMVIWNANPNKMYLLCLTDPDAPSRMDHSWREWHHWLVGNIPGFDISRGDILTEYVSSAPPKDSGKHRYTFLLYEQPGMLTFDEKRLKNNSPEGREKFSIRNFAKKYNLGEPIAGNYYLAEWDEYVPKVYEQMGVKM